MDKKLDTTLVGVAGEYLVAGELTLRGYIAAISLRNSRGVDIVASRTDGSGAFTIQVKTRSRGTTKKWILNKKCEDVSSKNHFYIFVLLSGDEEERSCFHVVPSRVVAKHVREGHSSWLKGKKKDGSPRKDSSMRAFRDKENKFLEAWHLLPG
jgi:hypothetical protein